MAILNKIGDGILKAIEKYLVDIPDMDDAKFERVVNRIAKLSQATAPTVRAASEGFGAGVTKQLTSKELSKL